MTKEDVFLDPSLFFDKRSLNLLAEMSSSKDLHLFTSKEFSEESLRNISADQFGSMRGRYGGWLGPNRQTSKEAIIAKIRSIPISFFSMSDQDPRREAPQFFDPDSVETVYQLGWKERVDIDEIWFLSTHSSALARLKKREKDLAISMSRLLRSGFRAVHLTLQHTTRADRNATLTQRTELRRLAKAGRWLIWLLTGATAMGFLPPAVPWIASGPIILSFEI